MNQKRLILLTVCWILVVIPGLSFANNESGTNAEAEQHLEKANELLKRMDYEAAIAEYEKVINLSSKCSILDRSMLLQSRKIRCCIICISETSR